MLERHSMSKNPWGSKGWREMRDAEIGDYCEQCGNRERPMVLQHFWHPPKFSRILKEAAYELGCSESDADAKRLAKSRQKELHAKYMSGENTATWCNKCAYLYDIHHKHLCPTCGKRYCDISYDQCYECWKSHQNQPSLF